MEPGYLGAWNTSIVSSLNWYKDKGFWTKSTETLKGGSLSGVTYLEGARCQRCRIALVRY